MLSDLNKNARGRNSQLHQCYSPYMVFHAYFTLVSLIR